MSDLDAIKLTRRGDSLVPADLHAKEFLDGILDGGDVLLAPSKSRSPQHHKWWEALVGKVYENLPENLHSQFGSRDAFRDAVKIGCGLYAWRRTVLGAPYEHPKTLPKGHEDFKIFSDASVDLMSKLLGIDVTTLMKEADKIEPRK